MMNDQLRGSKLCWSFNINIARSCHHQKGGDCEEEGLCPDLGWGFDDVTPVLPKRRAKGYMIIQYSQSVKA